jgi:hypothetical protein
MRRVRKLAEPIRLRVVIWNVGSLTGKLREIVDTMIRRRVNILCVPETKWNGEGGGRYRLQTLVHMYYGK